MNTKMKMLSLAIATILAGCASAPEKDASQAVDSKSGLVQGGEVVATVPGVKEEAAKVVEKVAVAKEEVKTSSVAVPAVSAPEKVKKTYKIPTDPHEFLVVSEPKNSTHPFYGKGLAEGFTVNGEQGKELVLTRGEKYKFQIDTGMKHDFYFTTSPQGWGAGTYTDGVEGQFIFEGEVVFQPSEATPDLLYYQCRNHKNMGGKVYVLDKGEDLAKLKASLAKTEIKRSGAARPVKAVSASSVKQKLGYAQMVLMSKSAKRVENSGNAEAIATLGRARQQIAMAKSTLAAGDVERAMNEVDEGLRLVTAASRAVTTDSDMAGGVNQKARYDELKGSLKTYEGSYAKNTERMKKSGQAKSVTLDKKRYDALVREGDALAKKGDYAAANKALDKAQRMITSVLTDMLHAQTIVYDKNFETPKEEYEYELARLESYEELVPLAIERKHPSQRALGLIDGFVKKAGKIKQEGVELAAKGDYKMAIMAMQAATSNVQRGLRIAGVN